MKVLSWNIKSFASAMRLQFNPAIIIEQIMNLFDLICICEVPNSANGNAQLGNLVNNLNALPGNGEPGGRAYDYFREPTGGMGNEDDQVGVIYDTNVVGVANTTGARRGNRFTNSGRAPLYFDVTDGVVTREFCAWHAPKPTDAQLIAQGWQTVLANCATQAQRLTYVVMGDFNANLTVPKRGKGSFLTKQITAGGGTTLQVNMQAQNNTAAYRTANIYDQFFVDQTTLTVTPAGTGIGDVLDLLANDRAPLTGLFGAQYNTPQKAYVFYGPNLSDHLPVILEVDL